MTRLVHLLRTAIVLSLAACSTSGGAPSDGGTEGATARDAGMTKDAAHLALFYDQVALLVGRPVAKQVLAPVSVPELDKQSGVHLHHDLVWVREHLNHLGSHAYAIPQPALLVAEQRRLPWWR